MSDYQLKTKIDRDDFNTIKADSNYFELNTKAKQIVDDIVELFEENSEIMQQLVSDIQNIAPDSTYYTKEAIDLRISNLREMQEYLQLELLEQSKTNTSVTVFIKTITAKINEQIKNFDALKNSVKLNSEKIDDLKQLNKDVQILSWQNIEYTAEFIRQEKNTGVLSVNQIGTGMPKPYQQPIDIAYSALNIHNHPNYSRMPGMGWFAYQANGYMGQTRHNDYRLNMQSASFMETVPNLAPSVPNYHFSVENMKDLFTRYMSKQLLESEKELFRWDLSYLECWWQEIDSLDGIVSDTFSSFRHGFGNQKPTYLANKFTTSRATGKKARFENIPFFPIASKSTDNDGNTKYSIFMYRIVTYPLIEFNGKRWDEVVKQKYDLASEARFGSIDKLSSRAKFEFTGDVNRIFENIPGLGGLNETIGEYKSIDGYGIYNPANKARYHRRYTTGSDAVGRRAYINGWNDPTLITAFTKNSQIVHGTSYMIPLELILRTPLETWNPNDLELKSRSAITGSGTSSSPYTGFAENFYNYHTPAEFYDGFDGTDPADTGKGAKAIQNIHGDISNYIASGIWIVLPKIKELQERVRIRYPIFWNAHEFSPSNIMLTAYAKENNEMMDFLKLKMIGVKNESFR